MTIRYWQVAKELWPHIWREPVVMARHKEEFVEHAVEAMYRIKELVLLIVFMCLRLIFMLCAVCTPLFFYMVWSVRRERLKPIVEDNDDL